MKKIKLLITSCFIFATQNAFSSDILECPPAPRLMPRESSIKLDDIPPLWMPEQASKLDRYTSDIIQKGPPCQKKIYAKAKRKRVAMPGSIGHEQEIFYRVRYTKNSPKPKRSSPLRWCKIVMAKTVN